MCDPAENATPTERDDMLAGELGRMAETTNNQDLTTQEPSEADVAALLQKLDVSPQSNLISVLQEVQDHFGYLPALALAEISRCAKIPLSRIYGVVSFYAQFYTEPHGRHTIRCCRGQGCRAGARGGRAGAGY